MNFSEALCAVMAERGIKQSDLVARSGLSRACVSSIVTGRSTNPTISNAAALARACGVGLDDVMAIMDGGAARQTPDEAALLASYRSMDSEGRQAARATVDALRPLYGQDSSPSALARGA